MPAPSTTPYPFGDLLALTSQSWLGEIARRLGTRGYVGYRRSDAAALRTLSRGPLAIGQLGTRFGVTRQAARKVADGGLCLWLAVAGRGTTVHTPDRVGQTRYLRGFAAGRPSALRAF